VPSGTVQVDDLQVSNTAPDLAGAPQGQPLNDPTRTRRPFADARVIADFESADAWEPLQGLAIDRLRDEARSVAAPGGRAVELIWRPVRGQPSTHGLRPKPSPGPLPVLASQAFIEQSGLRVGDSGAAFLNGSFVDLRVAGSFRLFPTLADPREVPALVANIDGLVAAANTSPRGPIIYPSEIWLSAGRDTLPRAVQAQNEGRLSATVTSFDSIRAAQESDPLVAAGWEGILFISFTAILMLSALGFLIYSYLTAQRRTLEFAVLRTMGFSRRQIATVVGFEQAFVILLGMLAGTLMGMRLGALMIRYMGVTETGDDVLPPMALEVSWLTVGSAWLVLGFAFLITIGVVVLLYARLQLHRVLRIGEL
jgi:hypothetical protein